MSKIYIPLPKKEDIDLYDVDGFFIGIQGYSYGFNNLVSLDELNDYLKSNKEVFITFNRLYYNNEIEDLKKLISELIKLNIRNEKFIFAIKVNNVETYICYETSVKSISDISNRFTKIF